MASAEGKLMRVEVAYALPHKQELICLRLPEGATVQDAIEASGLLQRYPEIDLGGLNKLGIYAKVVKSDEVLRDYDRVEIYRPIKADPKQARKQRAQQTRGVAGEEKAEDGQ